MRIFIFCLFLGACIFSSAEENKYTANDFAIDVFGQEQSEPINTGFFFHDGRYISPPYIVKRQGLSVFINDVMVNTPVPYPSSSIHRVPDELPEIPKNITRDSGPDDIVKFMEKTFNFYFPEYFQEDGNEFLAPEKLEKYVSRISELPCVKKIILVKDNNTFGGVTIYLDNGDNFSCDWSEKFPSRISEVDRKDALKQSYENSFNENVKMLKNGNLLIGIRSFISAGISKPEKIYEFVKVLNSDASESWKIGKLKAFDFSNEDEANPLLIKNYQYSEELTKRVEALYEDWKKSCTQIEKPIEIKKPDIVCVFHNLRDWIRNHYPKDTEATPYEWPCYMEEFGEKKGKAMDSGFVVFDGKPVKCPYIVSRKGLSVWINDTMLVAPPLKYPVELDPLPELEEVDFERIKENGIRGVDNRYFESYYEGLLLRYPVEEANKKLLEKFKSLGFDRLEMLKIGAPQDENDQDFVKIYDDKGTFLPESAKKLAKELKLMWRGNEDELAKVEGEKDMIRVYDEHGMYVPEDGSTPFQLFDLYEMRWQFQKQYGENLSPKIYSKEELIARYDAILKATEELLQNNCCIFLFSNDDTCTTYDTSDENGRRKISSILEILKSKKTSEEKAKEFVDKSLFDVKQANLILENEKSLVEFIGAKLNATL